MPDAVLEGGTLDCGSGLLLLVTRAVRTVGVGGVLEIRTEEPSVVVDLPAWARVAGHELAGIDATGAGARIAVRRGVPRTAAPPTPVYTGGTATPVGSRLWLYTNFDCNLSCRYCCAVSSPSAPARRLEAGTATRAIDEFADLGGSEVLLTGGEPFLHRDLAVMANHAAARCATTILTNAMIFASGARRRTLEALDRDRVTLQISLDSAVPVPHDRDRGAGSFERALGGMSIARQLGFRVRVAATVGDRDREGIPALHARLTAEGIPPADQLVRPVAAEGASDHGLHVSIDTLAPEPTITVDGAWWHPVAVTNPAMRVADAPLPVAEIFATVRDALSTRSAADAEGLDVFRCT